MLDVQFEMWKQHKFNYSEKDVQALKMTKKVKKAHKKLKKALACFGISYLLMFNLGGTVYGAENTNSNNGAEITVQNKTYSATDMGLIMSNLKQDRNALSKACVQNPSLVRYGYNNGYLSFNDICNCLGVQTGDAEYNSAYGTFTVNQVLGLNANSVSHETTENNTPDQNSDQQETDTQSENSTPDQNNVTHETSENKTPAKKKTPNKKNVSYETDNTPVIIGTGLIGLAGIVIILFILGVF